MTQLPIAEIVEDIAKYLRGDQNAVVMAPPGAGKSTFLPYQLLDEAWAGTGQIILLQPRRVAVRAVARQLAALSGAPLGQTIGYQMRDDTKRSARTRLMVMTQGVFRRRLLADPDLGGISAVIFDEYHERSLESDLCLALARDVQSALRPSLKLLVMSATLDTATLMPSLPGFALFESAGRSYPIETQYLPHSKDARLGSVMASAVKQALQQHGGNILCFLPGQAEIRQTHHALVDLEGPALEISQLFGSQSDAQQAQALAPPVEGRRRVILATDIAETSLTVPGVHCVIDSGLRRAPFFEDALGLTQLRRLRAAKDRLDQRRGRAGRLAPGLCMRLWAREEMRGIAGTSLPDVETQDLTDAVLASADWGVTDVTSLPWTTPPPKAGIARARGRLEALGLLDENGSITAQGRLAARLPLPADLAAMVLAARGQDGAEDILLLAALLGDGVGRGNQCVNLSDILNEVRSGRNKGYARAVKRARSWAKVVDEVPVKGAALEGSAGLALARARPHLLAQRRGGPGGGYKLAAGRGAFLPPHDPLSSAEFVVVGDALLSGQDVRITSAWPLSRSEIETGLADMVEEGARTAPNAKDGRPQIVRNQSIGALVLKTSVENIAPGPELAALLFRTVQHTGLSALPLPDTFHALRARADFAKAHGCEVDLSDAALLASADLWLMPLLEDVTNLNKVSASALLDAIKATIPYESMRQLRSIAPKAFSAPAGGDLRIDYTDRLAPGVKAKLQAFFGMTAHPTVGLSHVPLVITMLSPAGRPLQSTQDLPGFWAGTYHEVKKEMRGRYPKHPWPDDPAAAKPSLLTKNRQKAKDS